jgi:hypothetical protein
VKPTLHGVHRFKDFEQTTRDAAIIEGTPRYRTMAESVRRGHCVRFGPRGHQPTPDK